MKQKEIMLVDWLKAITSSILVTIIFYALLVMFILSSCNNSKPAEKVVIIDINYFASYKYTYKVKRIEKGVIDYYYESNLYDVGDTIFAKFSKP